MTFINETLAIALTAAPWLLIGLFAAGLLKALLPDRLLQHWLGGRGVAAISRAAVIGAPLPLCSCGAIPTAIALHRGGAGRGPTTAFLIGTPGIGVDSMAITYALLGPFMMLARALGAVVTAISTGLLVATTRAPLNTISSEQAPDTDACCDNACTDSSNPAPDHAESLSSRLRNGMRYAFNDILDEISTWLLIGLLVAGVLIALVPPQMLASWGSGLPAMLLMALIGIPMYICATAATPIAAGLLIAGMSPGTALVFLLAGPVTSLATLGILRREMGNTALFAYVTGILVTTVLLGLMIDQLLPWMNININDQISTAGELLPYWLKWAALVILLVLCVPSLRYRLTRLVPL